MLYLTGCEAAGASRYLRRDRSKTVARFWEAHGCQSAVGWIRGGEAGVFGSLPKTVRFSKLPVLSR